MMLSAYLIGVRECLDQSFEGKSIGSNFADQSVHCVQGRGETGDVYTVGWVSPNCFTQLSNPHFMVE